MNNFKEICFSSKRIFWTLNFAIDIFVVLAIGFLFKFEINEIFIQLIIAIIGTIASIWIFGGYDKFKSIYLDKKKRKLDL